MQFIIKSKDKDSIWNTDLDKLLKLIIAFQIDVVSISKIDKYFYIVVTTEKTKIKRLSDFCKTYMSFYDREYGVKDLDIQLNSGKINQKVYDKTRQEMIDPIEIEILDKERGIELPIEEQRDDKLTEILSK